MMIPLTKSELNLSSSVLKFFEYLYNKANELGALIMSGRRVWGVVSSCVRELFVVSPHKKTVVLVVLLVKPHEMTRIFVFRRPC